MHWQVQLNQLNVAKVAATAIAQEKTTSAAVAAKHNTTGSTLPHILFLLVDDMGWNDVGYSSNDLKGMTPNIDSLATGVFNLY